MRLLYTFLISILAFSSIAQERDRTRENDKTRGNTRQEKTRQETRQDTGQEARKANERDGETKHLGWLK